jgi:hypothetical protein
MAMRCLLLCVCALRLLAVEPAAAAADIDKLIDAELTAQHQTPLPPAEANAVVRRAWIVLGGRIPTAAEARLAASQDQATLIRQLVGSTAWNHATFSWLADLLRVQSRLQDRVPGLAWISWLRTEIAANTPWTDMAKAMLTASGPAFAADGGATGFILRDAGMPLDHAALAAQTFLGTRIGCAQCHDHPYDRWTRMDFTQFAAFSADARTQIAPGKQLRGLKQAMTDASPALRQSTRAVATILGARVEPAQKDWLAIPTDWQDDDAKPGQHVSAQVLFGAQPTANAGDPRQRLAAWMTSSDNPRFALAIGNRVWKRVFGLGLIEPVDDLRGDPSKPLPPLQARLAQLVIDSGYDLQRIHFTLCLTRHWARTTWTGDLPEHGGVVPGRPPQRLAATAWWDSLVALASDTPDALGEENLAPLVRMHEQLEAGGINAVLATAERLASMRTGGTKAAANDPDMVALVRALRPNARQRQGRGQLLRASVLPQPAPADHPVRILGQSDRELIDNANAEPATTQALLMMNGVVDSEILVARSRLMRELSALPDQATRIDHLWLAALARPPSPAERNLATSVFSSSPATALTDLAWTLLNGAEFRMVP